MRHCSALLAVIFVFLDCGGVSAELAKNPDCLQYQDYVHRTGWLQNGESYGDVEARGSFAYLAAVEDGLRVADISDPAHPVIVGSLELGNYAREIFLQGDLAFLPLAGQVAIVNVSKPQQPRLVGTIDNDGMANTVVSDGGRAYISTNGNSLEIHDIQNPSAPRKLGSISGLRYVDDISIHGDIVFVGGSLLLYLIDVSDPAAPSITASIDIGRRANCVTYHAGHLYVGTKDIPGWLMIFNVESPNNPVKVGEIQLWGVNEIEVKDDIAYTIGDYNGMSMVDVKDPSNPSLIGRTRVGDDPYGIAVGDGFAYATCYQDGLQIVDVESRKFAESYMEAEENSVNYVIAESDQLAYVGSRWTKDGAQQTGLRIYGTTNPKCLELIAQVETPHLDFSINDIAKYKDTVFMAAETGGLVVVDVSDPYSPFVRGAIQYDCHIEGLAVGYGLMTSVDKRGFLDVYKIEGYEMPAHCGRLSVGANARGVVLKGSVAYVCIAEEGLTAVDVLRPESPAILWNVHTPGEAVHVCLSGDLLHVADGDRGVTTLKFGESEGEAPRFLSTIDTPYFARRVIKRDGVLYVADLYGGVQIIDVKDPAAPAPLGVLPGHAYDVCFGKTRFLFAGRMAPTLGMADLQCGPASPVAEAASRPDVRIFPNPFNPQTTINFSVDHFQHVYIAVYDIRGYLIIKLTDQQYALGDHGVVWKGEDSAGREVPSGVYFFRVEMGDRVDIQKAILLR